MPDATELCFPPLNLNMLISWVDEFSHRKPGWTPGRLFVAGNGSAYALPIVTAELIEATPELKRFVLAQESQVLRGNSVGSSSLDQLLNRAAVACIQHQYNLTTSELLALLASDSLPFAITGYESPEGTALFSGIGDALTKGRIRYEFFVCNEGVVS